jgi:hypothetical protein
MRTLTVKTYIDNSRLELTLDSSASSHGQPVLRYVDRDGNDNIVPDMGPGDLLPTCVESVEVFDIFGPRSAADVVEAALYDLDAESKKFAQRFVYLPGTPK